MFFVMKEAMDFHQSKYEVSTVSLKRILIGKDHEVPQVALDLLKEQDQFLLHASGSSMFPIIQEQNQMLVRHTTPESIKRGDVIAFEYPGHRNVIVVHRVLAIQQGQSITFRTRGDRSANFDPLVPSELLLGKVVQVRTTTGDRLDFESPRGHVVNFILTLIQISSFILCTFTRRCRLPSVFQWLILSSKYSSTRLFARLINKLSWFRSSS